MRVLVTGAAGFIGSHLCSALLSQGFEVVGIDNLSVGRANNLYGFINNEKFQFRVLDISDSDISNKLDSHFTYIFHLAALADIVPSIKEPSRYARINVQGTINMLEFAKICNVKKFVYAASSSCYGVAQEIPTTESAQIAPEYPYALTKYLGELAVLYWHKIYSLPTISLRLFNVYGPRARTSGTYGAVFGVFLAQKLAGKPLTIVGDGTQTRDFTFVTDVVEAFIASAKSKLEGEIFNVGSGGTYSVNRLVELLDSKTVNIPKRPGEPDCTFADISKISSQLGWRPKISFDVGVRMMLEDLEAWKDAPIWTPDTIEKETELWFRYLSRSDVKNNGK